MSDAGGNWGWGGVWDWGAQGRIAVVIPGYRLGVGERTAVETFTVRYITTSTIQMFCDVIGCYIFDANCARSGFRTRGVS